MRIDIITLLPSLLESPFADSIMQRAINKGIADVQIHDLRPYGIGKHKQLDDAQFGGGAGLVMMCEPIFNIVEELKSQRSYDEVIYMTPDGKVFNQSMANGLSLKQNLIILCGHYKGIDQRIRDELITLEISIGDFVMSGGELGAAVISDAIIRLIPGVLNDESSALTDSFQDGLLAPPIYTRPSDFRGLKVPQLLLSGNFPKIEEWRHEQALSRTLNRRPDLMKE